jgi:hypothetical protein
MNPKEKAKELVEKFRLNVVDYEGNGINGHKAKQCALIAVNEILEDTENIYFWHEVKSEIEAL